MCIGLPGTADNVVVFVEVLVGVVVVVVAAAVVVVVVVIIVVVVEASQFKKIQ